MRWAFRVVLWTALAAAGLQTGAALAQNEQFIPILSYRTGAYAPSGIPIANGLRDYFTLINRRDGGINGVKITWEECETKYNTKTGIECYEKLKHKGPTGAALINPYSTGLTYQLIPKAAVDKIPILSMGYGRTAAADGRVFPWIFNFPTGYWSQTSAFIRYIAGREGGFDKLKGRKIVLVYHNSAYGKEPIATLRALSKRYGYDLKLLPVDHPGQEQKSTWLQVRRYKPDWVLLWGWGVMNQVAIKAASGIRFPMDKFIGVWWSGSEADVVPAGDRAIGYTSSTFHAAGSGFPVHAGIIEHVYGGDAERAKRDRIGEVLYNRGLVNAMFSVEAIRTAMARFGDKPMTGAQVRWGLETLNVTAARLAALGFAGFTRPVRVTCADHGTGGPVLFQRWTGKAWAVASDWIPPISEVVRPLIESAAAKYAKENGITPRDCGR